MTSECEHPNHLLKATSQSEFFHQFHLLLSFRTQSTKNSVCVCHIQSQRKVTEHSRNMIKKLWSESLHMYCGDCCMVLATATT